MSLEICKEALPEAAAQKLVPRPHRLIKLAQWEPHERRWQKHAFGPQRQWMIRAQNLSLRRIAVAAVRSSHEHFIVVSARSNRSSVGSCALQADANSGIVFGPEARRSGNSEPDCRMNRLCSNDSGIDVFKWFWLASVRFDISKYTSAAYDESGLRTFRFATTLAARASAHHLQ